MNFVKIALPYDYLTTVLECMETALRNSETSEEKEKIRRPYHRLLVAWGENAGIEYHSLLTLWGENAGIEEDE